MKCTVCSGTSFKDVDQYRHKPSGMIMCESCGFITYKSIQSEADRQKLTEFYREEYRDVPNINNVFTGQRKLHYHMAFLRDLFDSWKSGEVSSPTIGEVGSAFGMYLNWIKQIIPSARIRGAELTKSYRLAAFHEYKIWLDEKLDETLKYDLITSYKVAEHQPDIIDELKKYRRLLNDDGKLYISVPLWFESMTNFGSSGWSIEYYYHTNHVNVWTKKNFEYILARVGFKIVKENNTYYDSTYLCEKSEPSEAELDSASRIEKCLDNVFKASNAHDESKYQDAVNHFPTFPGAWVALYEIQRKKLHELGYEGIKKQIIDPMLAACPVNRDTWMQAGEIAMRYGEWKDAIACFNKVVELVPNEPQALMNIGHCFRSIADAATDKNEKERLFKEAINVTRFQKNISLQTMFECTNWIFQDIARLPMPTAGEALKSSVNDKGWVDLHSELGGKIA